MATSTFAYPLGVPIFRAYDANGDPLNGGLLYTYEAGTSTNLATYPTYTDALAGTNANANPVVLAADGSAQVWVQASFYKLVLKTSGGTTLYTQDNVGAAFGNSYPVMTEWVADTLAPAYVGATSFTLPLTDVTGIYHAGRRIKTTNTAGTVYSTVSSSSFSTNTTVVVINDGASVLDAGLSAVSYGFLSSTTRSHLDPATVLSVTKDGGQTGFATSSKITDWTVEEDALSEWDATNHRWVCKYAGKYLVTLSVEFLDTGTNVDVTAQIQKVGFGSPNAQARGRSSATSSHIWSLSAHFVDSVTAAHYIEAYFLGSANTTIQGTIGTRFSVLRIQ